MTNPLPLRPRPRPGLGAAAVGPEEEKLVLDVLRRQELFRYYGSDPGKPPPMALALEAETRLYLGVNYTLAVSSGTAALEIALSAAGIGPGDEVLVAAWSWISCFTAIVRAGATPVLVEINDTLCLDPADLANKATPWTRAVVVVHYQGIAAEMAEINAVAREHGWIVIEDCAEAPGTSYRGKPVGSWGEIAIFSFQHNKPVTAGEGGLVATNNPSWYERAVRLHDLGQYRPAHASIKSPSEAAFAGGQSRMSELTAAVALAQWRKLDAMRGHCRSLQAVVLAGVRGLVGLVPRRVPDPSGDFGFELYFFLPDAGSAAFFRTRLDARNVWCQQRTGTYPQYRRDYVVNALAAHPALSPFRGRSPWPAQGYRAEDFPQTEDLTSRFVALPLGWAYSEADAQYIADAVCTVHAEWRAQRSAS